MTRDLILQQLHNQICADLDRIKGRFVGTPKVSLVVRFEDPEKGIWLTDDIAADAIAYIEYMEKQLATDTPVEEGGATAIPVQMQPGPRYSYTFPRSADSVPDL